VLAPQWKPRWAERATFWRFDPRLGWAHRPGQRGRFSGPGFRVPVTINSSGLRDRERTRERSAGVRRVLVLGDSFGWGYGVPRESCVVARLEGAIPRLEVVNGSVSGYGTAQELLWYRLEGRRYQTDWVLLLVSDNDVSDDCGPSIYWYRKPYFVLEGDSLALRGVPVAPPGLLARARIWALGRTYLGVGIRSLWWRWRGRAVSAMERAGIDIPGEPRQSGPDSTCFRVTGAIVRALAADVRAHGARLAIALVPMPRPLAAWWVDTATLEGIPALDLHGQVPTTGEARLPQDPHWNALGHALAARALTPFVDSLLATAPAPP
jgi:lysophospholipase L1-like esterase